MHRYTEVSENGLEAGVTLNIKVTRNELLFNVGILETRSHKLVAVRSTLIGLIIWCPQGM